MVSKTLRNNLPAAPVFNRISCLKLLLSFNVRFFRYVIFELSVLLIYDLPFLYEWDDPSILQQQKLRSDALDFLKFDCK